MTRFNGLIQHSFALQIDREHQRFHGRANHALVAECFELDTTGGSGFVASAVGGFADDENLGRLAPHSPLVQQGLTDVLPLQMEFLELAPDGERFATPLPDAFTWAAPGRVDCEPDPRPNPYLEEARLIFADAGGDDVARSANDFLIHENVCESDGQEISRLLLEVVGQRRSRLFGLTMANRIVNAMLPHAILVPSHAGQCPKHVEGGAGTWFLQPLVSFIRDDRGHRGFRNTYALTLFLVPVEEPGLCDREMSTGEIGWAVNAGWSLATVPSPDAVPRFQVRGPLPGYLSRLALPDLPQLVAPPSQPDAQGGPSRCGPQTLRRVSEVIAFGVGLRVTRGSAPSLSPGASRRVGNDVVTALGSAHVSSLVFVDDQLKPDDVREPPRKGLPPGQLPGMMAALAPESRSPRPWSGPENRKYRLDRAFVDEDSYVVGVLPKNRCLIVASAGHAQKGRRGSGLMHAGSVAYMTIGAATAIGTMRAIDRDLEEMTGEDPRKIAEIDAEIAADLHEIYDLDITREAYRNLYRLLRDRLGIATDYKTLQDKMSTLYRATSTRFDKKTQQRLVVLTILIVVIGILSIVATLMTK